MSPTDYVMLPLKKYAQFNGRSDRPEYWWFSLTVFTVNFVFAFGRFFFNVAAGPGNAISTLLSLPQGLFALAVLVPSFAVAVRRLHDTGRSGWWLLVVFVPLVGWLVLLAFLCWPGATGPNKYGADPKTPLGDLAAVF